MRRILGALVSILLLGVLTAPFAVGEPVQSGSAEGSSWTVTIGGVLDRRLVAAAEAVIPNPCPDSGPCSVSDSEAFLEADVGTIGNPTASADALTSEADAAKNGGVVATLDVEMDAATPVDLNTADWNTRGFGHVEGFSALGGAIVATTLEAEAVSGTRPDGTAVVNANASGANVMGLQVFGLLPTQEVEAILPGQVNQVLFDDTITGLGLVRIVFWETNWVPGTASTPDGEPVWVNALHITASGDPITGSAAVDIVVAQAEATSTYVAPPQNQPPTADDEEVTTPFETLIEIDVLDGDQDPEGDLVRSIRIVEPPGDGVVDCSSGTCFYRPRDGFTGTDTFRYEVCDAQGLCAEAAVTIHVPNEPPVARDDEARVLPGETVGIDVLLNDEDPERDLAPGIDVVDAPNDGDVDCSTGTCVYEPDEGFSGRDWFVYRICDGAGQCDTATVTISVAAPPSGDNDPPVAEDDSGTTRRNTATTINVIANDSDPDDGDSLRADSVRVVAGPANGTVICVGGSCTYTPNAGFVGTDTFTYEVCDQAWVCDTALVTITVTAPPAPPVNQPPTAGDDTASTTPGTPVVIDVTGNDSDPENDLDESTLTVTDPPSNGDVECSNGSCTYTPDDGFTGTDQLTYEICDGTGRCDTATVVIVVQPTTLDNAPPTALDDAASTRPGTPVPITVTQNDSDPDGDLDTSSVRVVQPPQNGTVHCVGSLCTYTPDAGFTGSDSFIYEICDAAGACDTAVVTIVVGDRSGADGGEDGDNSNGPGGGGDGPGSNGGNGPDGSDGGSGNGPDLGTDRSAPGDGTGSPLAAPIPIPSLGAPGTSLPLTGGTPAGYLTLALYAIATGMLVLWKCRPRPVPAGGSIMTLSTTPLRAHALLELDMNDTFLTSPPGIATSEDGLLLAPDPVMQPTEMKSTGKKAGAKNPTATKTSAKKSTAVSTTKKASTRKKAPAQKGSASGATAATPRKRATSTKKSTVKKKTQSRKTTEKEES